MTQNQRTRKLLVKRLIIISICIIVIIAFGILWLINANAQNVWGLGIALSIVIGIITCLQWLWPMQPIDISFRWPFRQKPLKRKIDLFISYHSADSMWAEWMAGVVEEKGYTVMFQPWNGFNFNDEMKRINKEAEYIFIILSNDYLKQFDTTEEWFQDFMQDNQQRRKRSAFCVHKHQIKKMPSHIPFVSLVDFNETEAARTVLEHIPTKLRTSKNKASGNSRGSLRGKGQVSTRKQSSFPGFVLNLPGYSPFFVGYEDILERCYNDWLISRRDNLSVQPQAISGFIGSGKTRIAIEYVNQYRSHYRYVFWVNAISEGKLHEDFESIARKLNIRCNNPKACIEDIKCELEKRSDVLLILDRCEDLNLATKFIPRQTKCHIVLTTCLGFTGPFIKAVELRGLDSHNGARLLLHRTRKEEAKAEELKEAEKISHEMEGLPLALNQAGAYIEATGCSLLDFLTLYKKERAALLKRGDQFHHDYPDSVTTILSLAVEKIKNDDQAAYQLLLFFALLDPEVIPLEIISKGARHLGTVLKLVGENALRLDDAIIKLRSISLIRRYNDLTTQKDILSIHRLLQAVLQDTEMDQTTQSVWAERVVLAISQAFPEVKVENWSLCQIYQQQVEACNKIVTQWNIKLPEVAQLFDQFGCYLRERANYKMAESFLTDAKSMRESIFNMDEVKIATSLSNIAELYHIQGKYVEAEKLYKKALNIREQYLGTKHLDTAATKNNLTRLYADWGKYDNNEVRRRYQEVLVICEDALANGQVEAQLDIAVSRNNIAETYYNEGNYKQAKLLHQQALSVYKRLLSKNHPDVIRLHSNIGKDYIALEHYEYAEKILVRVKQHGKETLGDNHPVVAARLNNLAELYRRQKKYDEALSCYEEALYIYKSILGSGHPLVADVLLNKAALLESKNKLMYKHKFVSMKSQAEKIRQEHKRQNP